MEQLAILDHYNHVLIIDEVSDETLEKYNGEEEDYIKDNYEFEGDWSWEWITDVVRYDTDGNETTE